MKRTIGIVSALVSAVALSVTAPAALAEDMTTITMKVTGCNGCTITPVQALESGTASASVWTGTGAIVRAGQVVLTVPTAKTAGMSFNLNARWKVAINAVPVIVTQYQGYQPGQRVTKSQAKAAKKATACWAGTSAAAVTLRVTVRRVLMPAFPPDGNRKTKVPLAWLVPTAETTGGFSDAYKGTLGQQDAWYCP